MAITMTDDKRAKQNKNRCDTFCSLLYGFTYPIKVLFNRIKIETSEMINKNYKSIKPEKEFPEVFPSSGFVVLKMI